MQRKYISLKEVAEKWGIGDRHINTLCFEGRISEAFKVGNTWTVPEDAKKPKDKQTY